MDAKRWIVIFGLFLYTLGFNQETPSGQRLNGYKLIWFELGQKSDYGDKYSGGLGTYTAKHHPLAIYAPKVNKTFFVYGGTTDPHKRELLAMLSYYDHNTGQVPKPVVVHAKKNVNDPHDNPSLQIDKDGYLWIFVSGRGRVRPGFIYKSVEPFCIDSLMQIYNGEFAYPQPTVFNDNEFLFLFTKYTDGRELYWKTGRGSTWSAEQKLATHGHYQMTNKYENKVITAFNAHPKGVDNRTNLYYLQTVDRGKTWTTANGTPVKTPVQGMKNPALVYNYQRESRLVYLKDINFDANGNPVLLYITSAFHQPGPKGEPRTWTVAHWNGTAWLFHEVTRSTHNYDMGSLYVEEDNTWRIIAPTEPGPQKWGAGGEMALWTSADQGAIWTKQRTITRNSTFNHCYARRPVHAHPEFYAFWADGHADEFSQSRLYFTNKKGDIVRQLPYHMDSDFASPKIVKPK